MSRSKSSSRASASAVGAVGGDGRREAVGAQPLLEEGGQARLVLGDQDAVHRRRASCGGSVGMIDGERARPAPGAAVELDASAVGLGDRAHDRQAEAGALRAPAGAAARAKRSKIRSRSAARDARTAVAHPEPRAPAAQLAAERDRVALAVCCDGVVGEVHHRLGQPLAVGAQRGRRRRARAASRGRERGRLGQQLLGEHVEVDVLEPQEVGPLGLGEREQVLDEAAHAVELVGDELDGLAPLLRVVAEQLEVAADDRDRRAQLVAGVADEGALAARTRPRGGRASR